MTSLFVWSKRTVVWFSHTIASALHTQPASKVLRLVWQPYRAWYRSYGAPYLPRAVYLAAGTAMRTTAWAATFPWRLSRTASRKALAASMASVPRYYPVSCRCCGNVCSSSALLGGGSNFAGDYDDMFCPVCLSNERHLED